MLGLGRAAAGKHLQSSEEADMEPGPVYRRSETRVDDPYGTTLNERHVSTARASRFSPAAIVSGVAGIVLLIMGLIAVARGGLSGSITDPVVTVVGFDHTPLLGLIEAGVGLILLLCALWGTRASAVFMGALIAVAGIVIVATPDSFADTLAAQGSYGWFLIIVGVVVAVVALAVPDRSSRVVTYR